MRKYLYILLILFIVGLTPRPAKAFVIMDSITKIEEIAEMAVEIIKTFEEKAIKLNSAQRDQKLGEMGRTAHRYYDTISRQLRGERELSFLEVPTFLKGSANSVDAAEAVIIKEYIPVYGEDDMQKAKIQTRKNTEVRQNQIADLYAKAHAFRNQNEYERHQQVATPKPENARELVETGRAYTEKTMQRFIDVINMETILLDLDNTEMLMDADPIRLDTAKETTEGEG